MIEVTALNIGHKRVVASDLNFKLVPGNIYAIIGSNGAGKSTLMQTITGMIKPLSGSIKIEGKELSHYSKKVLSHKISFLPARVHLFANKNVEFLLQLSMPQPKEKTLDEDLLQAFELEPLRFKNFEELSDGQKQRVLIAMQFFRKNPIVFMDEPLNHLDIHRKERVIEVFKELTGKRNLIVALSIHDKFLLEKYFSHIIEL